MDTEVAVKNDHRIFLVGYGSASSTVGATRAGRIAARELLKRLDTLDSAPAMDSNEAAASRTSGGASDAAVASGTEHTRARRAEEATVSSAPAAE